MTAAISFDFRLPRGGSGRSNSIANSLGKSFFDAAPVLAAMDRKTNQALSRFGYFTMRDARQRIRKRKSASRPGQSPSNWSGDLKYNIFFYYSFASRSVLIGAVKLNGAPRSGSTVPQVLEEGGRIFHPGWKKGSAYIAPRPYMQPAFDRQIQKQAARLYAAGIFVPGLN